MTDDGDGLLGPAEIRELAAHLGLRPTKQLGQNFLHDANSVRRIVRLAGVGDEDVVVEVGPGLGSLTLGLLAVSQRVVAVEIDPLLSGALATTVEVRRPDLLERLEVVTRDALTLEQEHLPGPPPTAFVANLPYNVAVPVLLRMLERLPSLQRGLVMVQSEVADRLAAPPGSRTYGVPSVKAAWWSEVRRVGSVGRTVFWPAPHVDSALVAFRRREVPDADRATAFRIVDAAFAQRRKTLRAALSGYAGSAAAAEELLRRGGVDPQARGEALDVHAFARLAAVVSGGAGDRGGVPAPVD